MVKLFNLGCTGNSGRSPVGQLIANNRLEELGISAQYGAISSGTLVDQINSGKPSRARMLEVIGQARERGDIYSVAGTREIDDAVGAGDDGTLRSFYDIAIQTFVREEERYRRRVLPQMGIRGNLKTTRDQLAARPDVIGVLTMAPFNNKQAVGIHQAAGYELVQERSGIWQRFQKLGSESPLIAVISAYARDDPTAEVPNAFGGTEDAYRTGIETLMRDVPIAIDRLLRTQ